MSQPIVDLTETKEQSFEILPAGSYHVRCDSAQIKDTRAGTGQYLETVLVVTGGDHEGRKIWHRFNINNPSEKAQEIGRSQLKSFLLKSKAKNPDTPSDVAEFIGLDCWVSVSVKNDAQYGDSNEVKYFKDNDAQPPTEFAKDESAPF
jgi:hypothetical protein